MRRIVIALAVVVIAVFVLIGGIVAAAESEWFARFAARQASAALSREVTVAGAFDIDWSLHPRIHVPALTVANPDWVEGAPLARLRGAAVTVDLTQLPLGRLALSNLLLDQPRAALFRTEDGRSSWHGVAGDGDGGLLTMQLDGVRIRDGHLYLDDAIQPLRLDVDVTTVATDAGTAESLLVSGPGRRQGEPFQLDLRGGPLLALTDDSRPYPLAGTMVSGDTKIRIDGSLRRPLSPQGGQFDLAVEGPSPAVLEYLLGLHLPDLPPYDLQGPMTFGDGAWRFRNFSGTIGDSDIAGDLTVRPGDPLVIEADLTSRRFDLDDLAPAFGAAPATGPGETASTRQRQAAAERRQEKEVLPEATADRSRLTGIAATVRFRAERVEAPRKLPLERVEFTLRVEQGKLRFEPLTFGIGGGNIDGRLIVDAGMQPAHGQIRAKMRDVDLGDLLQDFGIPSGGFGTIRASLDARFAGDSVANAFGSADGSLLVYMHRGQVDAVLISLAGLDAGRALIEKFFGSGPTEIECAFTQLDATDGVAKVERFLIATEDIDLTAGGKVDFGEERFHIALRGYPRTPTVGASDAPVQLEGKFADAEVSVISDELLARGAVAALAALVAPPLAIVPFIHPGTGDEKEDTCTVLEREAKRIDTGSGGQREQTRRPRS